MQLKLREIGIVVVADSFDYEGDALSWHDRRIDRPHSAYIQAMLDAFRERFSRVIWYECPNDFVRNIQRHSNDVVVPYWFGQDSRNRHALVPGICEAANIRYIGGDVYTKTICNDKALSKTLCRQAGLQVADGVVVFDERDLGALYDLGYLAFSLGQFEGRRKPIWNERTAWKLANKEISCRISIGIL
jgi:D-alanine-D-alanine ligase